MDDFIKYLEQNFDKCDLCPEESEISSSIHLRFELGDSLENGTKERVEQSTKRATTLFEEIFGQEDDAWLLIKSWKYEGDATNFFKSTSGYLEEQICNYQFLNILKREKTIEECDEEINDDGVMETTNIITTHIQKVLCQSVSDINYEYIFRAIANLEMGFSPSIEKSIYFINKKTNVVFYMYDDRGCIIFSSDKDTLMPIYTKYNDWLVEEYRETFDTLFS